MLRKKYMGNHTNIWWPAHDYCWFTLEDLPKAEYNNLKNILKKECYKEGATIKNFHQNTLGYNVILFQKHWQDIAPLTFRYLVKLHRKYFVKLSNDTKGQEEFNGIQKAPSLKMEKSVWGDFVVHCINRTTGNLIKKGKFPSWFFYSLGAKKAIPFINNISENVWGVIDTGKNTEYEVFWNDVIYLDKKGYLQVDRYCYSPKH